MPTGYTAGVRDGSIASFKDYALLCARAFGACITMRDDPLSAEITEFEPNQFYQNKLVGAELELALWEKMTEEERRAEWERYAEKQRVYYAERMRAYEVERARYMAMLEKVREFRPPTPDHKEFVTFMRTQLEESIHWDCPDDYKCEYYQVEPYEEWVANHQEPLRHSLDYYAKEWFKENERTAARNKWVQDLKKALEEYDASLLCEAADNNG